MVFWLNKFIEKVKSCPHEHESLRVETTKLHKKLMTHGAEILATRNKIYEVLDLSIIVHDLES